MLAVSVAFRIRRLCSNGYLVPSSRDIGDLDRPTDSSWLCLRGRRIARAVVVADGLPTSTGVVSMYEPGIGGLRGKAANPGSM